MPTNDSKGDSASSTAVTVLRSASGMGDMAATLLGAVVPGGLGSGGALAVRGVFAAMGLVADLLERALDPVVQIEQWQSILAGVAAVDAGVDASLSGGGKAAQ